jgi:hypothetical protein
MWPEKSASVAVAPALRSQEGIMAEADFPLSINRRRLLTAAALTATGSILAGVKLADAAAAPDLFQSPPLTRKAEPANFSAATARRLMEIARRNEMRREAKLPLLSVPTELRRMKKQEELEEFERFETVHAKAVWEEVLKARREAEGNPDWRPSWIEGVRTKRRFTRFSGNNFTRYAEWRI